MQHVECFGTVKDEDTYRPLCDHLRGGAIAYVLVSTDDWGNEVEGSSLYCEECAADLQQQLDQEEDEAESESDDW